MANATSKTDNQDKLALVGFSLKLSARFESQTRYYVLRCEPDLLGDLVVSRFWGGKGSRLGGQRHQALPTLDAALKLMAKIVRIRLSHGYQEIEG